MLCVHRDLIIQGIKMMSLWKVTTSIVYLLLHANFISSQTTTLPTTTTVPNTPETSTQTTTTFVPTLTPLFTTEGTTFATADSSLPTTTLTTELSTVEATTEGQASNDALRASGLRRGYRFESTRSRPNANQEAQPETETQPPTTQKPEEKKIAWKFGRGGNSQEPWSTRPSPDNGFPVWKKETPAPNAEQVDQNADAVKTNPNDQAYILWSVGGQGNQQNGWTLAGGNTDGWAPAGIIPANAGWVTAEASAENNPETGGWNAAGWTQDQSVDSDEAQGWTGDEVAPNAEAEPGWDNSGEAAWNTQNQNAGAWVNAPAQAPPNGPPPNSWQPQNNGGGAGAWIVNPQQQGNDGQGGWVAPQQGGGGGGGGGGWDSQPTQGVSPQSQGGWYSNAGGWVQGPSSTPGNAWQNPGPGQPNNAGWNAGQQSAPGWNDGSAGSPGWQDGNLSWKVYNEDTKTMENLDDNSGWKVVGDGGPDGWKLIDENGNVEWKIENINGEWKVTSADEFSSANDTALSVPSDSANDTSVATNDTSTETTTVTPTPAGGWDDDKQGRYVIWKFSDDGKGEARVYEGPGSDPQVWTVGDNNDWWKESMGLKKANAVLKGGYNTGGGNRQANAGWQNAPPQADNVYQNGGGNAPAQNVGWQAGGGPQAGGTGWNQNRPQANVGGAWRNNGPSPPASGNGWQTGGPQRGNSRWQNNGGSVAQQKWNAGAGASPPQTTNGWQNQVKQQPGRWNTGNVAPPATGGWQNARPQSRPQGNNWQRKPKPQQSGWQNGATPNGGGWTNGGPASGRRSKGRWRNNGNKPAGRWASNNGNGGTRNGTPKGRVWNSGSGWRTAPNVQQQGKPGWVNNPPANNVVPPAATTAASGRRSADDGSKNSQAPGWPGNSRGGQTVPYIIVIKAPDTSTGAPSTSPPTSDSNRVLVPPKQPKNGNTRPQSNRRSGGYKMNRAGSSGWQWNPQGGNEGWQWRDGWMGSGGGFGGWTNDKGVMYSNWRPTKENGAQARNSSPQRNDNDRSNKKTANKMVFVFGTKRRSSVDTSNQPVNKGKKGKQVIIIDYTSGGKTPPKGDEGMKKDIESVIQALKTAKSTGVRGSSIWKQPGQKRKTQQWSRNN